MQVSIIIVNYNTFELTSKCIRSIYDKVKDIDFEIILIDNASTEKNPDEFKLEFSTITLIKSETNLGFAKGNNLGIQHAAGEYILLLNSDCELRNNAPLISYEYMKSHPDCGMSTVQLHYPNGRLQYNCRKLRTIGWELLEVIPLYLLLPKIKREELMLHHYFNHDREVSCDWVWGTYMFFPRSILKLLPGEKLAEDFFMYSEDVLWCWQIKQLGLSISFIPEGKVMHVHKGSSKGKKNSFHQMGINNHAIFMKRIYPNWKWHIFNFIYKSKQHSFSLLKKILN